ncbi:MAG: hypothetical protein FJY75_09580 [Candidatus Eisenbacteria bacterium]|uniref:SoxR reducing system RseC family protein n=1 Tax=Eiseniibacteriota bacterium TaxID=2212470 RepID=A0A937XDT4_UNCEI|nr:hypothetical protein [Candidatus Eisenbacteria bacterium]
MRSDWAMARRSAPARDCAAGCDGCPAEAADPAGDDPDAMRGPVLVIASAAVFLIPLVFAGAAAILSRQAPPWLPLPAALLGLAAGALLSRLLLPRIRPPGGRS